MTTSDLDAYHHWASHLAPEPIECSVVIPAYNESERILPTIGAIGAHMSARGPSWELIVADDGSTDNTVELLESLELANMSVLAAEQNGGKGSAVRRGVLNARGSYVLFADADQSTPIEQFGQLLSAIHDGADVAIGSRSADGASVANKSLARKVFSKGLNLLVTTGFGVEQSDTQCGFKLFTADAARQLFQRQLMDEFSFDLELLYLAKKFDLTVAEVPVEWIDAPGSTVDASRVAVEFLRDMAKIRAYDLRGRYDTVNHHGPFSEIRTATGSESTTTKVTTDAS